MGERVRPCAVSRRGVLRGALSVAGVMSLEWPVRMLAAQRGGSGAPVTDSTIELARFVSRTSYATLPLKAIEHAKMIIASTLASAAPGARIDSARILGALAKE